MNNKTTIALKRVPLEMISFQEVISIDTNNEMYLSNVNVLIGPQIIKKIRFRQGEKPYKKGLGKNIAIEFLKASLTDEKAQSFKGHKKKMKVNKVAVHNAASNLFSELGL